MIVHVAPAGKDPVPELTEAFLVPRGTMVVLNTGAWHLSAIPVNKETGSCADRTSGAHIFQRLCLLVDYPEDKWVEIIL